MTKEIRELRRMARDMFDNVERVSHILPRAYCVAKPARHCAVFAVPPQDREPQVRDDLWVSVRNSSCEKVVTCDWCSLAYIMTRDGTGMNYVIAVHRVCNEKHNS